MEHRDKDAMIGMGARWWKFPGARMETDSWEVEWHSNGKVYLHDDTGKVVEGVEVDNPEDAGVLAEPLPEERRRRELLLARLMLVMVDIVIAGDPLGLESARDLSRELRHTYPELLDEYP
jgi:hypothetical protein